MPVFSPASPSELFFVRMHEGPRKHRKCRWSKEARDLVRNYLASQPNNDDSEAGANHRRDLITRLHELTGYPRRACLYFARQLGVKDKQRYAKWTTVEKQKLLDLVALHPPFEVAKMMRRSPGSIRGMLYCLDATAQMGREWFTAYSLATALHIRVEQVQNWISQGWLKARTVETGQLKKQIIDPDDFAVFCKQYRKQIVGRRLNADRLDFVRNYVFPAPHVALLPAREQGYKRRKVNGEVQDGLEPEQAGLKFGPQTAEFESDNYEEARAAGD